MKSQLKGIIAGLVAGITIATGITAIATETQSIQELSTLYNVQTEGIRIVIDGKEFTCTDANGAVVKPMIYNGTTYIPARAVSTAFGKAVYWDGEESTVYLGKMDGKLEEPTVKLVDLKNIASERYATTKNVFDNYGNFYNSAIYCNSLFASYRNNSCEILLDKKYSRFKATLFVPQGADWEEDTIDYITIIGDEEIIFPKESDGKIEMTKISKPLDIEVDVTDVNDFKIIFNQNNGIRIANAGFYQ